MIKAEKMTFTKQSFKRFKKAYRECPDNKTFLFDEREFVKAYAKYVIEYIEMRGGLND